MRQSIRGWLRLLVLFLDDALIVFAVLLILWKLGVQLPAAAIMAPIGIALAILIYLLNRVLLPFLIDTEGTPNPSNMIGLNGEVITPLSPEGVVKVRGELWRAVVANGEAESGQQVIVVGLEGLKLLVKLKATDNVLRGPS